MMSIQIMSYGALVFLGQLEGGYRFFTIYGDFYVEIGESTTRVEF